MNKTNNSKKIISLVILCTSIVALSISLTYAYFMATATAIGKVIPDLEGKLLGSALRVPVGDGSLIDLTLKLKKNTSKEEINEIFSKRADGEVLAFTMDPVVSSDIVGETVGALVDGLLTEVLKTDEGELVKVVAWYDNELGYTSQMIRTMKHFVKTI